MKQELLKNGLVKTEGISLGEFETLADTLISSPIIHHGSGTKQRDAVNDEGTTATVDLGNLAIPLHKEFSYLVGAPDILMFYCNKPPEQGGETIICDGTKLYAELSEDIKHILEETILEWHWEAKPQRWQTTLGTTDKNEAIEKHEQLVSLANDWETQSAHFEGDTLMGTYTTAAITPTKWSEEKAFCNYALAYTYQELDPELGDFPLTLTVNDGQEFPREVLDEVKKVADEHTKDIVWKKGMAVAIDNSRFMHGRKAFSESREIFAKMGYSSF